MKKIKLALFSMILATGVAQALTPCNGFEIKIKNNLADDLLVTSVKSSGADFNPGIFQKINSKNEQVFTVYNSHAGIPVNSQLVFHTISFPPRKVIIQFSLKNATLICRHNDASPSSDFPVNKTRLPGKVNYVIG